jgi:2-polyprenyl-3-methyl-5-hydroxy-6-metoxy-1,4-benzoquinol methylase
MLNWLHGTNRAIKCRVCGHTGDAPEIVSAPHISYPNQLALFVRCQSCESASYVDEILAFEHMPDGDIGIFLRQYLESTAGIWEMLWPVAILDEAPQKSFLDVGCGFGFTADAWRTVFNPEAYGCDPAAYAESGRELLGSHIYHALLDNVPELAGKQFDIVYASEVIEHVPDPVGFVKLLASRIRAGGVVTLTTPAADFLDQKNDPGTVEAALSPGFHGFLFSRAALESLLRSTGFAHVIVERHSERLIAWASHAPIVRHDTATIVERYLAYLKQGALRVSANASNEQLALKSGYAYRLYKECLLRGIHAEINALRALSLANVYVKNDTTQTIEADPVELRAQLVGLALGAKGFGERLRFNLPQVALMAGFHSESLLGNINQARQWFELSQQATEVLCAPSVLHGLEAAAFYWQAEQRLLQYDFDAARTDEVCRRLTRSVAALAVPHAPTGGGAPAPEHVMTMIEAVATMPTTDRAAQLSQIARHFAAQAEGTHAAASLFRFVEKYLNACAAEHGPSQLQTRALTELEQATASATDRAQTFQSYAKLAVARIKPRLQPPSFASMSNASWKPTFSAAR